MVEAYIGLQFKTWGRFWFGQFDQNWGPVNYYGIPLSNYAYPRNYLGLDVGSRDVRLWRRWRSCGIRPTRWARP
jgi:hypothetical protein